MKLLACDLSFPGGKSQTLIGQLDFFRGKVENKWQVPGHASSILG